MKATIKYNRIGNVTGDITFNKTLNLYKIASKSGNLYLPESSIDYVKEIPTMKRRTSRRRKK